MLKRAWRDTAGIPAPVQRGLARNARGVAPSSLQHDELANVKYMHIPSVQSLLKKYHIRPKKRLGQNYLVAQPTMVKIVDSLRATRNDVVLEIGCGLGVMTAMLADRCKRVIAIDADKSSLDVAAQEFGSLKNIEWMHADILKVDIASIAPADKILVIGNIPYNISSPIMFNVLDSRECVERAVLMMQKELVDRVVAKPGGKNYGALSVMIQSFADCTKLFNVARTNFIPQPDVTSSVIEINFNPVKRLDDLSSRARSRDPSHLRSRDSSTSVGMTYVDQLSVNNLHRIVQAAFQKRRKTLRNALLGSSLNVRAADLDNLLARLNIEPTRRPETLSVEEFNRLAAHLALLP